MMGPFVNNGRYVFIDPALGGDGQNLDAGYLVPPQTGLTVGGAPVVERSHEYVIGKHDPDLRIGSPGAAAAAVPILKGIGSGGDRG